MIRAFLGIFLFVAILGLGYMGVEVSSIDVVYPTGAPQIASGFQSLVGVNGTHRGTPHQGIDIKGNKGQSILAAADGTVLEATVEHCWGPTIVVDHGKG